MGAGHSSIRTQTAHVLFRIQRQMTQTNRPEVIDSARNVISATPNSRMQALRARRMWGLRRLETGA